MEYFSHFFHSLNKKPMNTRASMKLSYNSKPFSADQKSKNVYVSRIFNNSTKRPTVQVLLLSTPYALISSMAKPFIFTSSRKKILSVLICFLSVVHFLVLHFPFCFVLQFRFKLKTSLN